MEVFDRTTARGLGGRKIYKFPNDVDSLPQFMHFRISKEYKFRRTEIDEKDLLATVTLPIPQNLQTNYSANYNSSTGLGLVGEYAAGEFEGVKSAEGAINKLKSIGSQVGNMSAATLKDVAGKLAVYYGPELLSEFGTVVGAQFGGAAGAAVGGGIQQAARGAQVGAGIARNPFLAASFEGVNFRNHNFSFTLNPRNYNDSVEITEIIKVFKNAMLPTRSKIDYYYDYPKQFSIDFADDTHLFQIQTSVLTGFDVNYHGKGAYYHDAGSNKAPTEVTLNMNFLETTIVLADDSTGSTSDDSKRLNRDIFQAQASINVAKGGIFT